MTDARVEHVPADPREARVFVARAGQFLRDGRFGDVSDAARQVLLHNAAIAASDAVLLAGGQRITTGDGAHVLRLDAAIALLGGDDALAERLDDARIARNEASYAAMVPAVDDIAAAAAATEELVLLAEQFVAEADR